MTPLNKDITRARAMERSFPLQNIKSDGDFEKIRSTAKDHKEWRRLSEVVCRAELQKQKQHETFMSGLRNCNFIYINA